jgi:tellurite resistance protein TerC
MTDAPRHRWADKLAAKRETYKQRGKLYRLLFITTGAIVTVAGIAMLVLPGPALLVIPVGLAMLAMEFAWAEHMLEKALEQAEKAQTTAKEASAAQKVLTGIAVALAAAAAITAVILWDIPVLPDS